MVEILRRGLLRMTVWLFGVVGGSIEEGFFPQKARKGAAVLTSRTSFGMTVFLRGAWQRFGLCGLGIDAG